MNTILNLPDWAMELIQGPVISIGVAVAYAIILLSLKGKPTCQKNLTKIVNCVLALLGWSLIFYDRAMDIAKNLGVISSDFLIFIYLLCVASVTFVNVALSELSDESQKKDDKL